MQIPALWHRIAHLIRPGRTAERAQHRRADAAHTLPIPTQRPADSGRYPRVTGRRHAR